MNFHVVVCKLVLWCDISNGNIHLHVELHPQSHWIPSLTSEVIHDHVDLVCPCHEVGVQGVGDCALSLICSTAGFSQRNGVAVHRNTHHFVVCSHASSDLIVGGVVVLDIERGGIGVIACGVGSSIGGSYWCEPVGEFGKCDPVSIVCQDDRFSRG